MAADRNDVISGGLMRLLADTAVLLYKAKHLSWRVNHDLGGSVRGIVQNDHRALNQAADDIARHILALGRPIPPSYSALTRSSSIKEELELQSEMEMIAQIVADHGQILADIDTLEVTLPLDENGAAAALLRHLAECHGNCRRSLGALLRSCDDILQ